MSACIGDYVTTTKDTYEMERTWDGVPFFNRVGIRQGILTGRFFSRFDTELSGIDCVLYEVLGEAGTYAVPNLGDLTVVKDTTLSIKKRIEDLYETCFPMQVMRFAENLFYAAQHDAAKSFREVKDWNDYKKHAQDEFLKVYIATGRSASK